MVKSDDIIHYYMGSKFRFTYKNNGEILESTLQNLNDTGFIFGTFGKDDWFEIDNYRKDGKLELFLIHPCDMTEQQKKAYKKLCKMIIFADGSKITYADTPESLHYLFAHSIDAFDLIETGQAVDLITGTIRKQNPEHKEIITDIKDLATF